MLKTNTGVFVAAIFSLGFMGVADAQQPPVPRQSTVFCGGTNFLRLNDGSEAHTTNYFLRNFHPTGSLTIDRLLVYNAHGLVIYNSAVSGLPASLNGILGPANNTLNPHQSAVINSDSFLPFLAQSDRPLQVLITWSSAGGAFLDAVESFRARFRDPVTGAMGTERSRSDERCRG